MENFKMVAKTFFGFEEILAKELQQLGAQEVEIGTRMVSFKGDKGFMYKANLSLRTALKILKPIYLLLMLLFLLLLLLNIQIYCVKLKIKKKKKNGIINFD
jgi:hypothetical protein